MSLQITGLKVDIGEGSRGGVVIGHTSTGKPIYKHSGKLPESKDFSISEHQEAAKAHLFEAKKHDPVSEWRKFHEGHARSHKEMIATIKHGEKMALGPTRKEIAAAIQPGKRRRKRGFGKK